MNRTVPGMTRIPCLIRACGDHRRPLFTFALTVICLLNRSLSADDDQTLGTGPDYLREIQPILEAHCFRCHGVTKQEAGLRLDIRSRALAGGDSGAAIVPGDSAQSELVRRVTVSDAAERMPPAGKALRQSDIRLIQKWIDHGARGIPVHGNSQSGHWAFRPIRRAPVPTVKHPLWCRNLIDHFVLQRLEQQQLNPSGTATRETLIRRLYLDLLGLPPAWDRVAAFVKDDRPDAWEQLVDEVLCAPQYGERWGRHWLDVVQYADSTGFESDKPREIWPYRDWVIAALNQDMPFDQFVIEQIAGDLLPDATVDQQIATGFHCNAMLDPGRRWESIIDQVKTTGTVFLGLTLGCAQCHSHKTDPVTQREFYQFYAFFNAATSSALNLPDRSDSGATKLATTLIMKTSPRPTHIFQRGNPSQPADLVEPGFPSVFQNVSPSIPADRMGPSRLDLAEWIVSPKNPLTARVTVNRIWQRFFGLGLVETESDFGVQTPPATHPGLLDRLAYEFRAGGWSLKRLHRLIVTSATYRQGSATRTDLMQVDPRNRLLARQSRLRLEAEIVRDVWLSAGGLLSHKTGGPAVFPWQSDGVLNNRATPAVWTPSTGEDRYRRGLYTWVWRLTPYPQLPLFNAPDGVTACGRRDRSNVPVQALTLLNGPTFLECAQHLAVRVVAAPDCDTDPERIQFVFRTCLSREPVRQEQQLVTQLLNTQRTALKANPRAIQQLIPPDVSGTSGPDAAAWFVVCRAVLNTDEFITRE